MHDAVEKILDRNIRPYMERHSGNVKVVGIEDGVLRVLMTGQCSCCPSARITFEELIKNEILHNVQGIKDVVLESNISEDMLAFAKKILNSGKQEIGYESRY